MVTAEVTIPAREDVACADIPITDDELGLEGNEVFEVLLETAPNIPSSSPRTATVVIVDDDGKRYDSHPR